MYFQSNDPIADFHAWDAEQTELLKRLPICTDCGEPIMGDVFYEIGDARICEDCLLNYRRWTDDYIDEE